MTSFTVALASGSWLVGLLLAAGPARAQTIPGRAPERTAPARKLPAALPPAQVEEALRLLLRADSAGQRPARGPESAGLVLDQTLTKLGRDFFELFYNGFEPPAGALDYTIVIGERPVRPGAALVAVSLDGTDLLELPLSPRYDQMVEIAAEAIDLVKGQLAENLRVSRQLEAGQHARPDVY